MAEQRGEKTLKATALCQHLNLVGQEQRLNHRYLLILSLVIFISMTSARVLLEDRFDDGTECHQMKDEIMEKGRTYTGFSASINNVTYIRIRQCSYAPNRDRDFGRDPNRLSYFSVRSFDVDNHSTTNASYGGGGGGRRDGNLMVGSTLQQEKDGASAGVSGGDMTPGVSIQVLPNNGGDGVDPVFQRSEHVMGSDDEGIVNGLEQESYDRGGGVGDREDGGGLVVVRWWEMLWVYMALWKLI